MMVVVTMVVDVPEPSVYVSVVSEDGDDPAATPVPDGLDPVLRGTLGVLDAANPALVAVALYEARAAEDADSACATGQTVCGIH